MPTTSTTSRQPAGLNGGASLPATPTVATAGPVLRRRVSLPRVLLGVALVLGFALAGTVIAARLDTRAPVLATARAVNAGQTITDTDLTVVRVATDTAVATTPASARSSVVGRTAAVPLTAGALIADGQLGAAAWPPAGQSVIAVAVKAGRTPAGLSTGQHVTVLILTASNAQTQQGAGTGSSAGQAVSAPATIVAVKTTGDQSASVVSLLLNDADALRVASAPGDASLVQLGAGR